MNTGTKVYYKTLNINLVIAYIDDDKAVCIDTKQRNIISYTKLPVHSIKISDLSLGWSDLAE